MHSTARLNPKNLRWWTHTTIAHKAAYVTTRSSQEKSVHRGAKLIESTARFVTRTTFPDFLYPDV